MAGRSKHYWRKSDDVRSSLDVLDRVIGEFDDGLLSSAESETPSRKHSLQDLRDIDSEGEEEIVLNARGSRNSLTEKIDDIFSQLTEEIYADEKSTKNHGPGKKSPTRNTFDPLPNPPDQQPPPPAPPPPVDRKSKPLKLKTDSASYPTQNSLDSDRPKPGTVLAAKKSFLHQKFKAAQKTNNDEVTLYNDNTCSGTSEKVQVEVHKFRSDPSTAPPPMPEKQKIHLKNASTERKPREKEASSESRKREKAVIQELKEKVTDKQGKLSKFDQKLQNSKTRSNNLQADKERLHGVLNGKPYMAKKKAYAENDLPRLEKISPNNKAENGLTRPEKCPPNNITDKKISPSKPSPQSSVSHTSNAYESVQDSDSTHAQHTNQGQSKPNTKGSNERRTGSRGSGSNSAQYRRSRSLGPLEPHDESMERTQDRGDRRSRSRGPADGDSRPRGPRDGGSKEPKEEDSRGLRDGDLMGPRDRDTRGPRAGEFIGPREKDTRGPRYGDSRGPRDSRGPADGDSRRSRSRGRSPSRPSEGTDRSASRSIREMDKMRHLAPPTPEEAQATLEKMLPRYPSGLPPERQHSLIDLRVTEDMKKRHRRSMAVGPYEDLPPHLRNHLIPPGTRLQSGKPDVPAHIDEQLRFQHQLTIEAQRDLLMRRGFPSSHPLVSGEIPIHPELLGHLHFRVQSKTLPLGPEDFRRFLPEMHSSGMQSAFPYSTNDLAVIHNDLASERVAKVKRQKSQKDTPLSSLQQEEIEAKKNRQSRSRSTDSRDKKQRPMSMVQQTGSGWFNPQYVWQEVGADISPNRHLQHDQHWFMRERQDLQSLPPSGTIKDSGLGEEFGSQANLSRNDRNRSSFGMILKDKFQKNPNMYFPSTESPEYNKPKKCVKDEDLSDTDTLIHNMSEGSFDKESSVSGGRSIGSNLSNNSNRSSGKSSLSHDSMNGTPQMKRKTDSITTPKPPKNTSVRSSNPSVMLNKKTIRNYTPESSSNMLKQFEDKQRKSSEKENKKEKSKKRSEQKETQPENRSSVEKMIEDFHRNLPPPVKEGETSIPFSDRDSMISGSQLEHPLNTLHGRQAAQTDTVSSQVSHWSVASSAASFDYHTVNSIDNRGRRGTNKNKDNSSRRKMSSSPSHLQPLMEGDYGSKEDVSPKGVRIPPEGASSDSQHPFVQRIEVKAVEGKSNDRKQKPPRKQQAKNSALDEIQDLLEPPDKDDEFSTLRQLISEGRISGLNEKPPTFKPPTPPGSKHPPAATKKSKAPSPNPVTSKVKQTQISGSSKRSPSATKSGDRPRKSREAPAPPDLNPPHATPEISFISGRRIHSVENLHEDEVEGSSRRKTKREERSEAVQRSTSMHMPRDFSEKQQKDAVAQLIADSTERKFKFNNIFKGMWKKKHYSFDLS